jgi:hypothetical protein
VVALAVQAAASPLHATEPFVAVTPTGAQARVEAAAVATPSPTAIPTLASTPAATATPAVAQRPATPEPTAPPRTPAPVVLRNHLHSADGRLDTAVGVYSDCSGGTALTHAAAAIDTCVTQDTYFVGHNPGVFTPLLSESVGSLITWWDGSGQAHVLRVVAVRSWLRANGVPPLVSAAVVAQFQTCEVSDGSKDWIYDVVSA